MIKKSISNLAVYVWKGVRKWALINTLFSEGFNPHDLIATFVALEKFLIRFKVETIFVDRKNGSVRKTKKELK